jgi:hypothetical protein
MTNFEEKIRPRIVFDLTIHRENFYRVDLINLTFHFDINFFAEKLLHIVCFLIKEPRPVDLGLQI